MKYLRIVLLLLLIAIPLFSHLDTLPIQDWDEARVAQSAYEMYKKGGNPLITTVDYQPDFWSTKPPLMIWLQVVFMKCIGVNELAVRLPAAIAAVLLCLLLYWFFTKYSGKPALGIFAALILVTTDGYIRIHGTRTGDYESLLILFTTAYCIFFFLYSNTKDKKYIYFAFLAMALGVLTKGVAAVLFAPSLLLYSFINKENRAIYKSTHLYISFLCFLIISLGYYLLREYYTPGYINAIHANELGGRFSNVLEDHNGDAWFYFNKILDEQFTYWYAFIPVGLIVGLLSDNKTIKRLTGYILILGVVYFTIINTAKTKLDWYQMPLYPFFAILGAIVINKIYEVLGERSETKVLPILFVLVIFLGPYRHIFKKVERNALTNTSEESEYLSVFLKDARDGKHEVKNCRIIYDVYMPDVKWYLSAYDYGPKTTSVGSWDLWKLRDTVAVYNFNARKLIEETLNYEKLSEYRGVAVYKLNGVKE